MEIATSGGEYAPMCGDPAVARRVLVIPALFDEANKLRRFTVDAMRALADLGVATVLPDLPGCNESQAALSTQTLTAWRAAMHAVAVEQAATHVLTIRGGALLAPPGIPLIAYAPAAGASQLRAMLRAAVLSEREAGREVTREGLMKPGLRDGLVLSGHALGATMLAEWNAAEPAGAARTIAQTELGGPGLWLRAEPGEDRAQSARLAQLVAAAL